MKTLFVEWINPESGAESSSFSGALVEVMTEPSGALVVFESPGKPVAGYGPGVWTRFYDSRVEPVAGGEHDG